MISILRQGPKQIVLGSNNFYDLKKFLIENFKGVENEGDILNAITIADENNTIIWITEPGKWVAQTDDVKVALIIPLTCDRFLSELINLKAAYLIEDSHISPGLLMMRVVGDYDKIIDSVRESYEGRIMTLRECLDKGTSNQTIICFSQKPINQNISVSDIEGKNVLIDMEINELNRKIRTQVLRFFNEGLKDSDWYDLQIRIFDRNSQYKLHFDRLALILDDLELGLILGEGWGMDHPRFLMSVLVYQVRLFTLLTPVHIKEMLLGLEYTDDGIRIADFDLIYRNKKVDWTETISKEYKTKERKDLGKIFRNKLVKRLKNKDVEKLHRLEEEILRTRD